MMADNPKNLSVPAVTEDQKNSRCTIDPLQPLVQIDFKKRLSYLDL